MVMKKPLNFFAMFNTTKQEISCVRQTKTPESTSVDSTVTPLPECGVTDPKSNGGLFSDAKDLKADSSTDFELAIALFKSFFFVPGLSMETVEQLKDFKEGAIHSGVLILYSKNGVLSADRPTGDYNRYMMNTKFPEYLSVTIVSDGEAVSFKLKPIDAPTVTDSVVFDPLANDVPPLLDEHQMRAFKAKCLVEMLLKVRTNNPNPQRSQFLPQALYAKAHLMSLSLPKDLKMFCQKSNLVD